MSTPAAPASKYSKRTKRTFVKPSKVWLPALKMTTDVTRRSQTFREHGYAIDCVLPGKPCCVPNDGLKRAWIGSKIPFELARKGNGMFELAVHRVYRADRRTSLTARVALHLPGGTMMELTESTQLSAPILAVQAWPFKAPHLLQLALGNSQGAQDVIAETAGAAIILTGCPINAERNRVVVLPYHCTDKKWVCCECGKMFETAEALAKHDNVELISKKPRIVLKTGRLGPFFIPTEFHRQHSWKAKALTDIQNGETEKAMKQAPTLLQGSVAETLRRRLLALASLDQSRGGAKDKPTG